MRKHDVRKWLHAILDLLPVILIPVFMIYSHRHDVTERTQVDVQYKYQSNEVNTTSDLVEGNIYHLNIDNTTLDSYFDFTEGHIFDFDVLYTYSYNLDSYAINLNDVLSNTNNGNPKVNFYIEDGFLSVYVYLTDNDYFLQLTSGNLLDENGFTMNFVIKINQISGLTDYSILSYTDYNLIESVEVNDTKSSVMTVFMDDFNNSIDKYFNMGNVFNLNGVYEWFNTNIFSGHAPTVIYSIWNIALYELVMDLLFLLYGLFMWFIDMIQKLMEKPLNSVR